MARSIIRDGASQNERLLPALNAGYVEVDELGFEELLVVADKISSLLSYRNDENRVEGDWTPFFDADEAVVLASILSCNVKRNEAEFLRQVRNWSVIETRLGDGSLAISALAALALASKINAWYSRLNIPVNVAAVRAREVIGELIGKRLGAELRLLYGFLRKLNLNEDEPTFAKFGSIWALGSAEDAPSPELGPDAIVEFLKANYYAFHNAILLLQQSMTNIMQFSLDRNNRDPAMGLFIAFLRLHAKIQGRFNGFSQKHLHFYYDEVLKVPRRTFVPDSAYLVLTPDIAGREVTINKGTEFQAGLDENGVERIYIADQDLRVTDAKVAALHSIHLEREELSSPENALKGEFDNNRQFVTAALLNRINVDGDGAPTAHSLFGVAHPSAKRKFTEDAKLGLAVASRVLLLKQGQRDITLTFKLVSGARLDAFVRRLSEVLETTEADAFFKAFRHMFRISVTVAEGWFEVEEYLPSCRIVDDTCDEACFSIQLRLADSVGSVISYSSALHGGNFDTDLPILRLMINPDNYLFPYSALSELAVSEIEIEAHVTGCRDVAVCNQLGQLSTDVQFMPFGPTPSIGDYLVVGCHEAAAKRLTAFEVEIEWQGLPSTLTSLSDYYRAYPMFGNAVFKARLAVLRDRKWLPGNETEQPETMLFNTEGTADDHAGGSVSRARRFSFDGLCQMWRAQEDITGAPYGFDSLAKDGFFRLTLSSPHAAFGHRDYSLVLSQVMMANARLKRFGLAKWFFKSPLSKPLPNPPYTPLVQAISVNYKAVSTIRLDRVASAEESGTRDKVYHLHPFGFEVLSPKTFGTKYLVPKYGKDGNLMIGLSATRLVGVLTLFFHLREDSSFLAKNQDSGFTWYYLSSNQWKRLEFSRVVFDTTRGFLQSGIVSLDIPPDINRDNTILPSELFWLRVAADGDCMRAACSVYGIYAQALKVSWKWQEGSSFSHLNGQLPAGHIKEAKRTIVGIGEIRQVGGFFGGVPAEDDRDWIVRVSERLKHKNRAVTPWDYERLILQRFPEIYKVKCFPCMSDDAYGEVKPGHLLIVLVPYPKESVALNLRPKVNALLLQEVEEFVRSLSSSFANIRVRNPAYEKIQVRCKVRFVKGVEYGLCLNRLHQDIFDYLSPWHAAGHEARFSWRISCNDIQSYIQRLDYIETVTGLSLLQVHEVGERNYRLSDTARQYTNDVKPTYPWSIAIPFPRQLIRVMGESAAQAPVPTGISALAIGGSFIMSRNKK